MGEIGDIVATLEAKGLVIWLDGETIRYRQLGHLDLQIETQGLVERRAELIAWLRQEGRLDDARPTPSTPPKITPQMRNGWFPVSTAQRPWLRSQLLGVPSNGSRRTHIMWQLKGPLNVELLAAAVRSVVERHEILRTQYKWEDGEAYQRVLENYEQELGLLDFMGRPIEEWQAQVGKIVEEAYRAQPRYSEGGACDAWLFRTGRDDAVFAMVIDHIALDNRSMQIIATEVFKIYEALVSEGSLPPFPPLQYGDVALLEDNWLDSSKRAAVLASWRDRIGDVRPASLGEQSIQRRTAGEAASVHFQVDADVTQRIQRYGLELGVPTTSIVSATIGILLATVIKSSKFVIDCVVDGRYEGLEDVVGCFVTSGLMIVDLTGDPDLAECVLRARSAYAMAARLTNRVDITLFPGIGYITMNVMTGRGGAQKERPERPDRTQLGGRPANLASRGPQSRELYGKSSTEYLRSLTERRKQHLARDQEMLTEEEKSKVPKEPIGQLSEQPGFRKRRTKPDPFSLNKLHIRSWNPEGLIPSDFALDLRITAICKSDNIFGTVLYSNGIVNPKIANAFAKNISILANTIISKPHTRLSELHQSVRSF